MKGGTLTDTVESSLEGILGGLGILFYYKFHLLGGQFTRDGVGTIL